MKIFTAFLFVIFLSENFFSQSLILNEVSQGPSGTKEYVEFLVVPGQSAYHCNDYCLDLRHWIIDDNNGYFSGGQATGTGVAAGSVRFSNNALWSCVPVGTLIVIYNDGDPNTSIPAQDLSVSDGNCRLIIPVSSNLLEYQNTSPSSTSSTYPTTGWIAGGSLWNPLGMSNSDDSFQIYSATNTTTPIMGVSWGNNNTNNVIYFTGPSSNKVYYFNNSLSNNPLIQANWTEGTCSGPNNQTPGAPNNTANANYISSLTNSCAGPLTLTQGPIIAASNCSCNGQATINAQGSIPPYTYNWLDNSNIPINQTSMTATGLCAGNYKCIVSSSIGCVDTLSFTITDQNSITPTFNPIAPVCQGTAYILPTTSTNNITGTWSPAFNAQQTTTYTFTPNSGSCAIPITLTVTIDPCGLNQETCFKIVTFTQAIASSCLVGADIGDEDPALFIYCNNTLSTLLYGTEWTQNIPAAGTYNLPTPWGGCAPTTNVWNVGAIPNNVTGLNVFVQTFESDDNNCDAMNNGDDCRASANYLMDLTLGNHILNMGGEISYAYTVTETTLVTNATLVNTICNGATYNANITVTYQNPVSPCGMSGSLGDLVVNGQTFVVTGSPQTITLTNIPANGQPVNINAYFNGNFATCQYNATNVFTAPQQPSLVSFTGEATYCGNQTPANILVDLVGNAPYTVTFLLDGQSTTVQSTTNPISLGNVPGVYELTQISGGGCSASTSGIQTITISNGIIPIFDSITPICSGTNFSLPTVSNNGIIGTWSPTFNNTQTTTYTFNPTAGQCANTTTLTVGITNATTPTFPMFGPYCLNDIPDVLPTTSNNGINGTWNPPVIDTSPTGFNASYTFTPLSNICASSTIIQVIVNSASAPSIPDQTICLGESATLDAIGSGTYVWSDGIQNGVPFYPTSTAIYTLTTTQLGCSSTSQVTVFVDSPTTASLSADVLTGLPPLQVNFTNNSTSGTQFYWDFGNGLNTTLNTTIGQTMTYNQIGTYQVVLSSSAGVCENSDTVLIEVIPFAPPEIIVPNVFTPNGDNVNDSIVVTTKFTKTFHAIIVNRWGDFIYEITTINGSWDGKYKSQDCTEGVYFLLYDATDYNDKKYTGQTFFHLIR